MKELIRHLKKSQRTAVFKGVIAGALLVKKDAQENTPRRLGNLRTSAYVSFPTGIRGTQTITFKGRGAADLIAGHVSAIADASTEAVKRTLKQGPTVAIGYTAPYALSVHENPRSGVAGYDPSKDLEGLKAEHVHSRVGGWKFLSDALQGAPERVKQAIAAAAKLPSGPVRT